MSDVVLGAHIIDALAMINEKGDKSILEPTIANQKVVIILVDSLFISVARITFDDVLIVLFSGQRDEHGEMR